MNRDHADHVEDVEDEQSFAGLGMDVPSDEDIVSVASAEAAPMTCQICGFRTYFWPSSIPSPCSGQTRRGRGSG